MSRRVLGRVLPGMGLALLCACSNQEPSALYVDMAYQVRCIDCMSNASDNEARRIRALDGEMGLSFECTVRPAGDDRIMSFRLFGGSDDGRFGLQINQVVLGGDEPGGRCRIVAREGANTYEGSCTADEPDADTTCRIDVAEVNGVIEGDLRCDLIRNANAASRRYVVAPGTRESVEFEIHGCRGT